MLVLNDGVQSIGLRVIEICHVFEFSVNYTPEGLVFRLELLVLLCELAVLVVLLDEADTGASEAWMDGLALGCHLIILYIVC